MIIEVVTHSTLFTASCTHSDYTQKDLSRKKKTHLAAIVKINVYVVE